MRSGPTSPPCSRSTRRPAGGFTLAEVLAALLFMTLTIPVAVEALRIAAQAGQVAARKAVAARFAERVLNELVVTGQWQRSSQNGTLYDGAHEYRWTVDNEPWEMGVLRQLNVEVLYTVQGREYAVVLSTLVDPAADATTTTTSATSTGSSSGGQGGNP